MSFEPVFLSVEDWNGIVIADPEGLLYQAVIDIAEKTMDKSGLADLLRGLAKPS